MSADDPTQPIPFALSAPGRWICVALLLAFCLPSRAEPVQLAVAANFAPTARELANVFAEQGEYPIRLSVASSGQLASQILQGAPFDVFLSADSERVAHLLAAGVAVQGSEFTYALGRLALYSPLSPIRLEQLGDATFSRMAIANPDTAPYGKAAIEVLTQLDVLERVERRLVKGNNVAQALQFIDTGNAELGLIALSLVKSHGQGVEIVSENWHQPIRQDGVLLENGKHHPGAGAWIEWLRSDTARQIIKAAGYDLPQ